MKPLLALGSIGLGIYLVVKDDGDGPVWLPWVLIFIVPIIILQTL